MAYIDKIKVLLVKQNEAPQVIQIQNTLASMRKVINGEIDISDILQNNQVCLIRNGSRNIKLAPNRIVNNQTIYGDFLIVGSDNEDGDFKALTPEQIDKYTKQFTKTYNKTILDRLRAQDLVRAIIFHRS